MEASKPEIIWLNRKKTAFFFSIEKVFSCIKPYFNRYNIVESDAETREIKILPILKNLKNFRKLKADIFHITGDIHYATLVTPPAKTILTIHDCVFLNIQNPLKKFILKMFWLTLPIKRSKIITTISEQSKREILQHSSCDPSKIVVIPDPIDPLFVFKPKLWPKDNRPVILQVGTKSNKNLPRVTEALAGLNCKLIIVGKLSERDIELLKKFKIDFVNHQLLSQQQLVDTYHAADLMVFVSMYEGFGLPLVESQAVGMPVVSSNIEPMKSIANGSACLVDPLNVLSIREGIQKVIADSSYRESLIQSGLRNVERFKAEKVAEAYAVVYDLVLNK